MLLNSAPTGVSPLPAQRESESLIAHQEDDPDFIIRKVNFAYENHYGSVIDHSEYDYTEKPESLFTPHCLSSARSAWRWVLLGI